MGSIQLPWVTYERPGELHGNPDKLKYYDVEGGRRVGKTRLSNGETLERNENKPAVKHYAMSDVSLTNWDAYILVCISKCTPGLVDPATLIKRYIKNFGPAKYQGRSTRSIRKSLDYLELRCLKLTKAADRKDGPTDNFNSAKALSTDCGRKWEPCDMYELTDYGKTLVEYIKCVWEYRKAVRESKYWHVQRGVLTNGR